MYKVLLVDDEAPIRERVAQRIPWEELGFELTAACKDGREAIKILEKETINLVITDIRMPYVNGLELIQYVYENRKSDKVIIISGYSEFEYAKQALKYKVSAYLLKPITASEIIQVLKEAKEALDKERKIAREKKGIREIQNKQFLFEVAQGNIEGPDIKPANKKSS